MFYLVFSRQRAPQVGSVLLEKTVRIGRSADCDLQLEDASVSRRHATVFVEESPELSQPRVLVRDEASVNGTYINGVRLAPKTEQLAKSGDTLRFGVLESLIVWKNTDAVFEPELSETAGVDLSDLFSASALRARMLQDLSSEPSVEGLDRFLVRTGMSICDSVGASVIAFAVARGSGLADYWAWTPEGLKTSTDEIVNATLKRCVQLGQMQLVESAGDGGDELEISVCIPMSAGTDSPGAVFVTPEQGSGYTTGELEFLVLIAQITGRRIASTLSGGGASDAGGVEDYDDDLVEAEQTLCLDGFVEEESELSNEESLAEVRLRALISARDDADAANRAKSEFLANVSHELRTPLHAILSFSGLGVDRIETATKEKLASYFGRISQSGRELLRIVNDLLDLSRLEAGKALLNLEPVEVGELVSEVLGEFESLVEDLGLTLRWQPPPPETAIIDRQRIKQVLRNLVGNAAKFSPRGGTIEVMLAIGDGHLHLSVLDEGPGVPEDELESIFDKFAQSSRTKTGAGGTGLGLAISSMFVTAHRGRIWVVNRDTGGSIFRCTVPLDSRFTRARADEDSPCLVEAPENDPAAQAI